MVADQLLQLDVGLAGFRSQRHGDVQVAEDVSRLRRLPGRGIGSPQRQFQISLSRLPVFFQQSDRFLRPALRQKNVRVQNVRIPRQQRLRICRIELPRASRTASAVCPV